MLRTCVTEKMISKMLIVIGGNVKLKDECKVKEAMKEIGIDEEIVEKGIFLMPEDLKKLTDEELFDVMNIVFKYASISEYFL